mgnify:CR=1 FL=1
MECCEEHSQRTSRNEAQPCSGNTHRAQCTGLGLREGHGKEGPTGATASPGDSSFRRKGLGSKHNTGCSCRITLPAG